jgi:hypothetical protein
LVTDDGEDEVEENPVTHETLSGSGKVPLLVKKGKSSSSSNSSGSSRSNRFDD